MAEKRSSKRLHEEDPANLQPSQSTSSNSTPHQDQQSQIQDPTLRASTSTPSTSSSIVVEGNENPQNNWLENWRKNLEERRRENEKRKIDEDKEKRRAQKRKSMKNTRLNPAYRSNERKSDADRKRQKRLDPGVRQHEQQTDTARRANTRQNPDVLEHEREQRATARLDPGVLEHEREQRTIARNNLQNSKTVQDLIKEFHEAVEQGPVLSCYVCNTIQYPYNVVELTADSLPNCGAVSECTADAPAGSWLCKSCQRYLKQKEYPPMSAANGMVFPVIPENFKDTRELEWSLASPRKAFMKIFAAPRGEQHVIRGNVVNVPFNVNETVQSLPRLPNDHETIQVEIKRDLRYKNVVMSQAVRPERVRGVAQYLCSQQLFREQNITYDNSWALDSAPESEVPVDRGN